MLDKEEYRGTVKKRKRDTVEGRQVPYIHRKSKVGIQKSSLVH